MAAPQSSPIATLLAKGFVVTDGAWGTQLQERGLPVGGCPESWNRLHPDRVEDVARAYVEAGSHVILTNTFGGNRTALARHGLGDSAAELNRQGAAISRRAAGRSAQVFGSIGPSGVLLMMEEITPEELYEVFREQAEALAAGTVDGLVVETMADLEEANIAVRAARTTGLPVVACMTYGEGPDRCQTMMGVTPEQAATGLAEAGADVIGANCGNGPDEMLPVCKRLRAVTALPLWMKPNAGLPQMLDGKATYDLGPEPFAEKARALAAAGASFVGGCCGTTPAHLRALAATRPR